MTTKEIQILGLKVRGTSSLCSFQTAFLGCPPLAECSPNMHECLRLTPATQKRDGESLQAQHLGGDDRGVKSSG